MYPPGVRFPSSSHFLHRIYGRVSIKLTQTVESVSVIYRIRLGLCLKTEGAVLYLLDTAVEVRTAA